MTTIRVTNLEPRIIVLGDGHTNRPPPRIPHTELRPGFAVTDEGMSLEQRYRFLHAVHRQVADKGVRLQVDRLNGDDSLEMVSVDALEALVREAQATWTEQRMQGRKALLDRDHAQAVRLEQAAVASRTQAAADFGARRAAPDHRDEPGKGN